MTVNRAVVFVDKRPEQATQGDALRIGARVSWPASCIKTANVTYTDGLLIVADAVRANHFYGSPRFYQAVKVNDEMITYTFPSLLAVPAVNVGSVKVLACVRRTAVYYDFSYCSH